jgi:hypothetical protein
MAMAHTRDKPTFYKIVGEMSGTVFATAPASRVQKVHRDLTKQYDAEKLLIVLIEETDG